MAIGRAGALSMGAVGSLSIEHADLLVLPPVGSWQPRVSTTKVRLTSGGRRLVDVDVYSREEAREFLARRFIECHWAGAVKPDPGWEPDPVTAVAEELGRLPLGLSIAAQYIGTERITCQEYLDEFRRLPLREVMPGVEEDYRPRDDRDRRTLAAAMTLSLPAAEAAEPAGYATAAMRLISVLDPNGHPESLWSTPSAQAWLRDHRAAHAVGEVTPRLARQVLVLLHRYGLITHNPDSKTRTVTVHALTQRAVLDAL